MTSEDWKACTDARRMLDFLHRRVSERKLRLFACASLQRRQGILMGKQDRAVLRLAELQADGKIGGQKLARAYWRPGWGHQASTPFRAISWNLSTDEVVAACIQVFAAQDEPDRTALSDTVREVFGNPFFVPGWDPSWRTEQVVALAQQSYAQRDFSCLPILADALEEAGCVEGVVLDHLRAPGRHALGCWALDLALGRA